MILCLIVLIRPDEPTSRAVFPQSRLVKSIFDFPESCKRCGGEDILFLFKKKNQANGRFASSAAAFGVQKDANPGKDGVLACRFKR